MNSFGITETSYQLILDSFSGFPEIEEVWIFGSRAKGSFNYGSDIDLAIKGESCNENTAVELNVLLNEVLPVPYFFDIIDYQSIKSADLKEHIDRIGKIIYTRDKYKENAPRLQRGVN